MSETVTVLGSSAAVSLILKVMVDSCEWGFDEEADGVGSIEPKLFVRQSFFERRR